MIKYVTAIRTGTASTEAILRRFTTADRRGLTPLFWSHVAPYGEVRLNMTRRLELASRAANR